MRLLSRLAPLSAVAFFLLLFVGMVVIGGDTPDSDATAAKVTAFYTAHRGEQQAAAILLALGSVFLLWFTTVLREELRQRGSERLATAALTGGIVAAVGFLGMAGSHFAVADVAHKIQPAAAQALNATDGATWIVSLAGMLFLAVTLTVAVFQLRVLPRALGYLAAVLAIVMLTPVGWIAWLAMSLWLAAAGIILARRAPAGETSPGQPVDPFPATA
jgi:hypothetical protein